jgi:hypothetical protein
MPIKSIISELESFEPFVTINYNRNLDLYTTTSLAGRSGYDSYIYRKLDGSIYVAVNKKRSCLGELYNAMSKGERAIFNDNAEEILRAFI